MRPSCKYLCQCVSFNNTKNTTVFLTFYISLLPANIALRQKKSPAGYPARDFSGTRIYSEIRISYRIVRSVLQSEARHKIQPYRSDSLAMHVHGSVLQTDY